MKSNKNYPRHVSHIIEEVYRGADIMDTLQQASPMLSVDNSLYFIYVRLGYSPETGSFLRPVTSSQLLGEIQQEYKDAAEEAPEQSSCVRDELLRTFQENGYEKLSSPAQVGLTALTTPWTSGYVSRGPSLFSSPDGSTQSKGLKYLSLKVKEIICRKGLISYKQVADELITQMNLENTGKEKEEKNVLRRVYDALNVLIAVGVVVKASKRYFWQGVPTMKNSDGLERQEVLSNKRYENQVKRENLMGLTAKYCALREIMCRNEATRNRGEAIMFPFIVVATEEHHTNNIKIEFNKASTNVVARFTKPIRIVEDIELILNLDLAQKNRHIPTELIQILENKGPGFCNGFYK